MALNILTRVKSVLNLSKTDNDTFLTQIINDTELTISTYIQQPISQVGMVLDNILIEDNELILPYTVPIGIISIKYKIPFGSDWTTLLPTEYYTYKKGHVTRIKFNYLNTRLIYEIACSIGWLDANIPLDILSVATDIVCWKYKESVKGENLMGKVSNTTTQNGLTSTTVYDGKYIQNKLKLLSHYKKTTI